MKGIHPGDLLDHYRIENLVARSGMASICKATDMRTGQPVAIKIPHPEMEADPALFDRFKREAEIGEKLDHPGVMKVLGGEQHSRIYMVMEWVDGKLLRNIMHAQKKLPPERAIKITIAILRRARLHPPQRRGASRPEAGKHHGGRSTISIKLIDFGIAGKEGARRLTFAKLSQVMGTPDYISPEQVKGKRGDGRSDIYAAGRHAV